MFGIYVNQRSHYIYIYHIIGTIINYSPTRFDQTNFVSCMPSPAFITEATTKRGILFHVSYMPMEPPGSSVSPGYRSVSQSVHFQRGIGQERGEGGYYLHPSTSSLTSLGTAHLLAAAKVWVLRARQVAPKQPASMAFCRALPCQPKT